ncbi:MAG: hypothetical protein MUF12_00610 [Sediminibacterium sp.]|nr:hypothetical protein [Sediminibacterium sp.]
MKLFLITILTILTANLFAQVTSNSTRAVIDGVITPNNTKAITAASLNSTMKAIVDYADTKAGLPTITVSPNGKSITIRPSNYVSNPTPPTPIEVDPPIITTPEKKLNFEKFHGNDLFMRTYNRSPPTATETLLSGVNEVWQMTGELEYNEAGFTRKKSKTLSTTIRQADGKPLLEFDETNNSFVIRPCDCSTYTNVKYIITLKYSKL